MIWNSYFKLVVVGIRRLLGYGLQANVKIREGAARQRDPLWHRSRQRRVRGQLDPVARLLEVESDWAPLVQHISINGRGMPWHSLETVINLISATTTSAGLKVYARLDEGSYPDKIKVPDQAIKAVNLTGDELHPEWNDTIKPKRQ